MCLQSTGSWARESPGNTAAWAHSPVARHVHELARALSQQVYRPVAAEAGPLARIGYDQYRDIQYRPDKSIWRVNRLGFEVQIFPTAYIYNEPVDIHLVENGRSKPLRLSRDSFEWGPLDKNVKRGTPITASGFRIHAPLNSPADMDELIVFQGASYFRGLGQGHGYGLSARGLSIGTVGPQGEEFPRFRSYWIERPDGPHEIVVHALLDSPSITGAYRFVIRPGPATVMETDLVLFPRRDLASVGISPLTSMFWFNPTNRDVAREFRDAVHDSDGLAIANGQGEQLWRPLLNPRHLQVSSFMDHGPKGFGLMQRERRFEKYQDLEARYHVRPSAWIEPIGDWGSGAVELVEIPTRSEYYDNIVAAWRPEGTLAAGQSYRYAYRLHWCDGIPAAEPPRYHVVRTSLGEGGHPLRTRFVVDFADRFAGNADPLTRLAAGQTTTTDIGLALDPEVEASLSASAGRAPHPFVQANSYVQGYRVSFELDPGKEPVIDLRLHLHGGGQVASEIWTYRWLAPG